MLPFAKYHGAGNDFVCIDDREGAFAAYERQHAIAALCDRHRGIGADGLLLLRFAADGQRLRMLYYNADGAPSSFCGNGARCFVRFAADLGLVRPEEPVGFDANDGPHEGTLLANGTVSVSMALAGGLVRVSTEADTLDTGSPHFVTWVARLPQGDIRPGARAVRYHDAYAKTGGINVNYVTEEAANALALRTYERGVEDETLACGTGVTAAALSYAVRTARVGAVDIAVRALGGELRVTCERGADGSIGELRLIGPAVRVFSGTIEPDAFG